MKTTTNNDNMKWEMYIIFHKKVDKIVSHNITNDILIPYHGQIYCTIPLQKKTIMTLTKNFFPWNMICERGRKMNARVFVSVINRHFLPLTKPNMYCFFIIFLWKIIKNCQIWFFFVTQTYSYITISYKLLIESEFGFQISLYWIRFQHLDPGSGSKA